MNKQVTEFITTTVKRDNSARDEINKSKKDFYSKYSYLKPDCEKNAIEKIVDKVEKAAEWCAKHWKLIATAVIVVVAVALIATGVGAGIGGPLLVGACWGAVTGAVIGGVAGGLESMSKGGTFLDGFEDGAFSGAVGGAIGGAAFAGLGAAGAALGKGIKCMSALAVFTGGMTTTMKCFVAGTLVLTSVGLKRIEDIKIGDRVFATDIETMKSEYKEVLDTFVRKTNELIHIFIGEEEIVTTTDHPFWVKGKGFVPAMNLVIGSELINGDGHTVYVENILWESSHDGVEVFNFKVEEYHTYYVGESCILVHMLTMILNCLEENTLNLQSI